VAPSTERPIAIDGPKSELNLSLMLTNSARFELPQRLGNIRLRDDGIAFEDASCGSGGAWSSDAVRNEGLLSMRGSSIPEGCACDQWADIIQNTCSVVRYADWLSIEVTNCP
jgi:hypothetical protein